ncbi:hypothetical protein LUZ60_001554 [Juncus effusus]|nr:hypothetical protein LUZ60_001554 [Juncus effusus]
MARRSGRSIVLLSISALFFLLALFYLTFSVSFFSRSSSQSASVIPSNLRTKPHNYKQDSNRSPSNCCKGVKGLELWGSALKWGDKHKLRSAESCCKSCKETFSCNTWVFCGDKELCKDKFGECWLKRQEDPLSPEIASSGDHVMWTSGVIFPKNEGVLGIETNYGLIRVKLLPDCAPLSVDYLTELIKPRHCNGCRFFRAESRGPFWNFNGDHIAYQGFGPPYGLIQGTLESDGIYFKPILNEEKMSIKRGSVAWVGSGPEFFISLANHNEWRNLYSVFGFVANEDMEIVERIGSLSTKEDVWGNVTVLVLQDPVYFKVRRV